MRKLAQQIDGGGQRELRCAEAGDEVAAANAAGFFESFEHVVDGAESAGDVFCSDGFARENAVAIEKLQGEGMAGFGCGGTSIASLPCLAERKRQQATSGLARWAEWCGGSGRPFLFARGAERGRSRVARYRRAGRGASRW